MRRPQSRSRYKAKAIGLPQAEHAAADAPADGNGQTARVRQGEETVGHGVQLLRCAVVVCLGDAVGNGGAVLVELKPLAGLCLEAAVHGCGGACKQHATVRTPLTGALES